jgi:hypothetical protein
MRKSLISFPELVIITTSSSSLTCIRPTAELGVMQSLGSSLEISVFLNHMASGFVSCHNPLSHDFLKNEIFTQYLQTKTTAKVKVEAEITKGRKLRHQVLFFEFHRVAEDRGNG